MEMICYVNGDKRIHVDRADDGSLLSANLLTNHKRGFRKKLGSFESEEELSVAISQGFVEDFRKEF